MKEKENEVLPIKLNLQFFAEDQVDEGGTDEQRKDGEPDTGTKTFTQEEVDEILTKRLSREQKKYEKFKDYNDIKTQLDTFLKEKEKRELDELGEVDKAQKLIEAEKLRADKLESDYTALTDKVRKQAVRLAFTEEARKANIDYIDDALRLADLSGVEVDEEYNVSGISDIVKSLVESKPFLVKEAKEVKDIGNPSNPKKVTDKTKEQLLDEAKQKAIRTGRQEDRAAYAKLKRELGI